MSAIWTAQPVRRSTRAIRAAKGTLPVKSPTQVRLVDIIWCRVIRPPLRVRLENHTETASLISAVWAADEGMMVAKSLDEVRAAFDDDELAAAFGRRFMEAYASSAFGVLPKREIDLAIFSFLIQNDVVDADGSMYRLARALNLTPARARSLLFEYQIGRAHV